MISSIAVMLCLSHFSYGDDGGTPIQEVYKSHQYPQKIIPVGQIITDMVIALGLSENIIAPDTVRSSLKEKRFFSSEDIQQNLDIIRDLKPDIILTTDKRLGKKIIRQLRSTKIKVVIFPAIKDNNLLLKVFKDVSIALRAEEIGYPIIWDLQDRISPKKRVQQVRTPEAEKVREQSFSKMVSESEIILIPILSQTTYPSIYRSSKIITISSSW